MPVGRLWRSIRLEFLLNFFRTWHCPTSLAKENLNSKKKKLVGLGIAIVVAATFLPLKSQVVVPEWKIQFVDEHGAPVPSVQVDQLWKDYSLEFWKAGENSDRLRQSGIDGNLSLPAREIRVSLFQLGASKIRDAIMSLNPHASFGPSSYIICRKERSCLASFARKPAVQHVVVR